MSERPAPRPQPSFAGLLALVLFSLASLASVLAAPARAQHAGEMGTAPPPPAGEGSVVVQIVNRDDAKDVAELEIALYSLGTDGQPGFTSGRTDASGRVAFGNLSSDPGIVYLVGARYRDIPFGERVTFEAGAREARVELEVSAPIDRADGVRVEELRVRLDWLGDRVVVREIVRLVNPGGRVIQLARGEGADAAKSRAIFSRPLAPEARDFELGTSSLGDGLAFEDGAVRYFGPLYPGDQRVEYQYTLPGPKAGEDLRVPVELDPSAGRVVAVAGTPGMMISGPGLVASSEVGSDAGKPLSAWARGALGARERSMLEVTLPATRVDPSLVEVPRADVWLDLDDTRLTATVDVQLAVAPGSPVVGTPEAPLLSVTLPEGASLTGVAPEAEGLGLVPRDHGGFDVLGPLGEGVTNLGYAYRLDAKPEGVDLDLRFSRPVSTLNVLIADTGLALESGRLHRLRPFRSGTRNYLHREAFNVMPDETVDLRLEPLRARGVPREVGLAFAFASIAGAAAFLMAPLTRRGARLSAAADGAAARLRAEREATYVAIGDLDHDFETGKLEDADYTALRAALRDRAIELLRAEQAASRGIDDPAGSPPATAPDAARSTTATTRATAIPTTPAPSTAGAAGRAGDAGPHAAVPGRVEATSGAGFCPGCGSPREAAWRFCASCGAALPEAPGRAEAGA